MLDGQRPFPAGKGGQFHDRVGGVFSCEFGGFAHGDEAVSRGLRPVEIRLELPGAAAPFGFGVNGQDVELIFLQQ